MASKKVFTPGEKVPGVDVAVYTWTKTMYGPQNDFFPFEYWKRDWGMGYWIVEHNFPIRTEKKFNLFMNIDCNGKID